MAAGDNVCGADSSGGSCKQMATSDLILAAAPQAVLVLGDVQYECGEASDFTSFYAPSWGRIKGDTHPSVGNHEYRTSTDPAHDCFGNPPGRRPTSTTSGRRPARSGKGYYSFDVGAWHLIALNSNCSEVGRLRRRLAAMDLAAERPGGPSRRVHPGLLAHPALQLRRPGDTATPRQLYQPSMTPTPT